MQLCCRLAVGVDTRTYTRDKNNMELNTHINVTLGKSK